MEIWQLARDLAVKFHRLAEKLEQRKLFRYAEQLRGAGLSMPNNIAEGLGSLHAGEFKQFLNIARRSTFENASMLLVFEAMTVLAADEVAPLLEDSDKLSRMITNYSRTRYDGRRNHGNNPGLVGSKSGREDVKENGNATSDFGHEHRRN